MRNRPRRHDGAAAPGNEFLYVNYSPRGCLIYGFPAATPLSNFGSRQHLQGAYGGGAAGFNAKFTSVNLKSNLDARRVRVFQSCSDILRIDRGDYFWSIRVLDSLIRSLAISWSFQSGSE
jgi:hypothetical protein